MGLRSLAVEHAQVRVAVTLVLAGCGHEVGRIPLAGAGTVGGPGPGGMPAPVQVVIDEAGQRIGFGVRIDATSRWPLAPVFAIELRDAAGVATARTTCNLRRSHRSHVCTRTSHGWTHSEEHCGYGTRCALIAPTPGTFTVHAQLSLPDDPEARIERLDLVVKR